MKAKRFFFPGSHPAGVEPPREMVKVDEQLMQQLKARAAKLPMSSLSVRNAFWRAIQSDTLTISAFEVGLFGWMAFTFFVLFPHPHLTPDHDAYWFMMQIGMALGLVTSYPVNIWLIRRGIKYRMGRPTRAGMSMTRP